MARDSARFVAYGFTKEKLGDNPTFTVGGRKITIKGKTGSEKLKSIKEEMKKLETDGLAGEFEKVLEAAADHEWIEVSKHQLIMSNYPKSIKRYYAGIESWQQSVENYYYWILDFLGALGFPVIDKITDTFTAAEHSSFYGAAGQRLGLAQDKVGQYLATIGKMIKDMFQLVRELRWIDERLETYYGSMGLAPDGKTKLEKPEAKEGHELALKGLWVDMVDGVVQGQRTGSNLFTMAQQLQFTTLPDLFFSANVEDANKVVEIVEKQFGEFNTQVKNALKRKLTQYLTWKSSTFQEIKNRKTFTLKYLSQHYQAIRLYITWIKPYLKHIERLTPAQDVFNNPRLISAFESSLIEIEVLAKHRPKGKSKSFTCILVTIEYHTKPSMQYQGDAGYHRGPIHVGNTRITWRSYAWTEKQVENYKKMRDMADLETLASVDETLKVAMEALGEDIEKYLKQAQEGKPEEEKKEDKKPLDILEPFTALGKSMTDVFGSLKPTSPFGKKKSSSEEEADKGSAKTFCFVAYNIFKKAHGMLSW
ncbi:hypothetical protein COV18_07610 [Candidatus Woesearchaeota archaeon CG10_big_fil_rev_8_21_14_0_10_37_12]|nr:MAG: hypothetical protein COV18_07610 [Candidatus Woesearchaeota archaeon CG10_big_fil_rev_8_21_14_0_10_37_12]